MSKFAGKEGFVWWIGIVENRHDPMYLGRCQVRISGWHTTDRNLQPTGTLPWAYPLMPITSASQTGVGESPLGLVEGSQVFGFFRDGEDGQEPVIIGSLHGIPEIDLSTFGEDNRPGFTDPRRDDGDPFVNSIPASYATPDGLREEVEGGFVQLTKGHPLFPDEGGTRPLKYTPGDPLSTQNVPKAPSAVTHSREGGVFTVDIQEIETRNPYPDKRFLNEPTVSRLARGFRGSRDVLSVPGIQSGIVYDKLLNATLQFDIEIASKNFFFSEPVTPYAAIYPYNHVTESESGHVVEVDDTPGAERLHWYHRSGTFTEIHPSGAKVDKVVGDRFHFSLGKSLEHIESHKAITTRKDFETLSFGSHVMRAKKSFSVTAEAGDLSLRSKSGSVGIQGSGVSITSSGSVTISGKEVNIIRNSFTEETTGNSNTVVSGEYSLKSNLMSLTARKNLKVQVLGDDTKKVVGKSTENIIGLNTSFPFPVVYDPVLGLDAKELTIENGSFTNYLASGSFKIESHGIPLFSGENIFTSYIASNIDPTRNITRQQISKIIQKNVGAYGTIDLHSHIPSTEELVGISWDAGTLPGSRITMNDSVAGIMKLKSMIATTNFCEISMNSVIGDLTIKMMYPLEQSITMSAATSSITISNNFGANKIIMDPSGITIDGINVFIKGKTMVQVDGGALTEIKAPVVKTSASGLAETKAGLIKLN